VGSKAERLAVPTLITNSNLVSDSTGMSPASRLMNWRRLIIAQRFGVKNLSAQVRAREEAAGTSGKQKNRYHLLRIRSHAWKV